MRAIIFDIERNSYVDGPGIRTTVFFKGCNLKCAWCHNPESQSAKKEFLFYKDKCTGCIRCDDVPVVPGVNDTEEEMERIKKLFEEWGYPEKVEFLPYHAMGEHKYASLGREAEKFEVPNKEKIEKLRKIVVPY